MNKKALSVLVILTMLLIMLPVYGMAAAEYNVWVDRTRITSANSSDVLKDGKVSYVHNDETGEGTLTLNGANITTTMASPISIASGATVNITLIGDNTLNASGASTYAGLNVPEGATVTISGAESLSATGGYYGAGIGGNTDQAAGTIIISGGAVTASGGSGGAGIGGGYIGTGGTIIINNGTVTATGGDNAAGIGGGYARSGGTITISGGAVTATGGQTADEGGSGIGGGSGGSGGTINISGGTVTATGGGVVYGGTGIGGGYSAAGITITISDGTVTATGGGSGNYGGSGIGGGYGTGGGTITISGGTVTATGGGNGNGIGAGNISSSSGTTININGGRGTATGSGSETGKAFNPVSPSYNATNIALISGAWTGTMARWGLPGPGAPVAPTLVSKTHNTVTLTANATYEFSRDGSTWQPSNIFTGLTGNTEYTFYQRVVATGGTPASEASAGLSVTTDVAPAYETIPYSGNVISEGHQFPVYILEGPDNKIYVSEYFGNKVIKMDKDGSNHVVISTDFNQPIGMCFDSAGNLFVAEHGGRKISKIDSSGSKSLIKKMDDFMTGLVFDRHGKLYAVNYQEGYIYKMDGDGTNQSTFANLGSGNSVIGLAVDNEDNIYASINSQNKIVKVTPDGTMTDFTTVSFPNWVSIGKDGYLYASSGDRSIQKFDLSGTKLAVYQTGSFSPWGTWISPSGYIYFTDGSAKILQIVVNSETIDKTHLTITLNNTLTNGIADPSAFTVSGVASNPQVISAVVSGSTITLTLDSEIASTDENVKVSYEKTGTNNIVISGPSKEIDNFSNLTIVNNIKGISSVGAIANITVANGTSIESIGLPSTVNITLSDSTTTNLSVTWDGGTPAYNGSAAGTYTFTGALNVTNSIDNPLNRVASVDVVVGATPGGGGGGGSDSDSSPEPTTNPVEVIVTPPAADRPTAPTQGEIRVPVSTGNNGSGTVQITNEILNHAFERTLEDARRNGNEGNGIALVLRVDTGNSSLSNILVNLPKTVQDAIIERQIINTIVVVQNPDIRIGMDLNTVRQINNQANTDVNITANRRDNNNLPEEARNTVGNRPVFDLRVNYGSTGRVQNFGDGSVTVTIPYTLGANEKPENVQAVYVDEDGKLHWLPNSVYDSVEKVVRFSTSHFSIYGVGYKEEAPVITDISTHWAKNDIDFVMNKGLLVGTSPTTFGPNTGMTRGMFVTVLGRLAEADVDAYKTSSFTDVKSDAYYMSSVEWAKEKGIVNGMGEGLFAPEQTITREQMAAIILNYAEFIDFKLPKVNAEKTFADNDKISSYAKDSVSQVQMAGVIGGKNGNVFDPQGTATRAEFSSVLRRFVELVDQLKK